MKKFLLLIILLATAYFGVSCGRRAPNPPNIPRMAPPTNTEAYRVFQKLDQIGADPTFSPAEVKPGNNIKVDAPDSANDVVFWIDKVIWNTPPVQNFLQVRLEPDSGQTDSRKWFLSIAAKGGKSQYECANVSTVSVSILWFHSPRVRVREAIITDWTTGHPDRECTASLPSKPGLYLLGVRAFECVSVNNATSLPFATSLSTRTPLNYVVLNPGFEATAINATIEPVSSPSTRVVCSAIEFEPDQGETAYQNMLAARHSANNSRDSADAASTSWKIALGSAVVACLALVFNAANVFLSLESPHVRKHRGFSEKL